MTGLACPGDVLGRDRRDALTAHVVDGHASVEGEGCQDCSLGGSVVALDVGGRVRLGEAELLRLADRVVEGEAVGSHLVEDVVGGAVDDAQHPLDRVSGERLAHGADDRDRPRDRSLVVHVDPGLVGRVVERGAVFGEQGLVGRDDRRPTGDRAQQQGARRLDAAHDLDDDVRSVDERLGVVGEERTVDRRVTGRSGVPDGDADQLEPGADARSEVVGLVGQQARDLGPDHPAAEECDAERRWSGHCGHPSGRRSVRLRTLGCGRAGRSWSSWWDEVEQVVRGREVRTTDGRRGCSSGGRPQDTRSVEAGEPPVRRRAGRASRGRAVDDHGSAAQARRVRRSISDRCLDPRRWRCRRLAPRRSAGLRGHRSWTPAPRGHGSCGCRARPGP